MLRPMLLSAVLCGAAADVTLNVYSNTGLAGSPAETRNLATPVFSFPSNVSSSAEVLGSLGLDDNASYTFSCNFGAATLGFLWVDDHLVCQQGAYGAQQTPAVRKLSKETVPFRMEVYFNVQQAGAGDGNPINVSAQWTTDVPVSSRLTAGLPAVEMQRRQLQKPLITGWGAWSHNSLFDMLQLPSGATMSYQLCEWKSGKVGKCLNRARPDDVTVRMGNIAADFSYGRFNVGWESTNLTVEFTAGEQMSMSFALPPGDNDYAIVVTGRSIWFRDVDVAVNDAQGTITFQPFGLPPSTVRALSLATAGDGSNLVLPLGNQTQTLSTDPTIDSMGVLQLIQSNLEKEKARYAKYGDFAETRGAVQAGVMWNVVYTPAEAGLIAPVSRGWDFTQGKATADFGYVIFDWDNIFASYMLAASSKELAYSNLIQVIRSKTVDGFVPNFAAGMVKSRDRTEPPIGAKVLLDLYNKFQDKWLVELLFNDILDWNNWFVSARETGPIKNLICLGGTSMQNARFESGLDNSPMYDGDLWNKTTGLMGLYDVGMTSMFAMEAEALADLADVIGNPVGPSLRARAQATNQAILDNLWDAEYGIFVNKFLNGTFNRRISPTSFYPLLTGAPSATQVASMIDGWLMNSTRFCISAKGDYAGNSDDCYWGLPSISADDPAFPPLGYWRGYVWGPMMQLVYWGLKREGDSVRSARQAFCKQMNGLLLQQWHNHGRICENYGPHKDTPDCTGNKFYHWGALAGLISLEEHGYY